MKEITIYTGMMCGYCDAAKHLLNKKNLKFNEINVSTDPILGSLVNSNNFKSRDKYSMKNLVVADFSSNNNFTLNKLYTTVMIGVTFASFIFLTYGLSSSITTVS